MHLLLLFLTCKKKYNDDEELLLFHEAFNNKFYIFSSLTMRVILRTAFTDRKMTECPYLNYDECDFIRCNGMEISLRVDGDSSGN